MMTVRSSEVSTSKWMWLQNIRSIHYSTLFISTLYYTKEIDYMSRSLTDTRLDTILYCSKANQPLYSETSALKMWEEVLVVVEDASKRLRSSVCYSCNAAVTSLIRRNETPLSHIIIVFPLMNNLFDGRSYTDFGWLRENDQPHNAFSRTDRNKCRYSYTVP